MNDDAVCHRIAEGNADFYHIHSVLFECTDYIGCAVERGEAGTKVDRQQVFGAVLEELVDTIHSEFVITDLLLTVTLSAGRRLCRQPAVSPVLIAWRNFSDAFYIFVSRSHLKAAVDVDYPASFGVMKLP